MIRLTISEDFIIAMMLEINGNFYGDIYDDSKTNKWKKVAIISRDHHNR